MSIKMPSNPAQPEVIFNNAVSGILQKDLTSAGAVVALTDAEAQLLVSYFNGTLITNVEIVVPDESKMYYIMNETTGAFTLTIKTAAGVGVVVGQGANAILVCDGADVYRFTPDVV